MHPEAGVVELQAPAVRRVVLRLELHAALEDVPVRVVVVAADAEAVGAVVVRLVHGQVPARHDARVAFASSLEP